MNLSIPKYSKYEDSHPPGTLAEPQGTYGRRSIAQGLLNVIVSIGLVGWLHGLVQAETFGPLANGDVPGLIDAIDAANANGEPDTILLTTNGTYTLSSTADARIPFLIVREGNSGLPSITSTIMIQGNGSVIERDASLFADLEDRCSSALDRDKFRIIHVAGTGTLTLDDVTLQNGCAKELDGGPFGDFHGGGILNDGGEVILIHSTVRDNTAFGGGGGIWNGGILNEGGEVILIHSTVRGNTAFGGGGGIRNGGIGREEVILTLMHSTVRANVTNGSRGEGGGGILNESTLTLTHSTVRNNTADSESHGGGGIFNTGSGTLRHSTVRGNTTFVGNGGGIVNQGGTLTLTNSTVSGNTADDGGGIFNETGGTLALTNSTVSGNLASDGGGILFRSSGALTLTNTIVADQAAGEDCVVDIIRDGAFTSKDFNLDSDGTCLLDQPHDKPNNPHANLCTLQVYPPGNTATHALLPGSAAIDMGDCSGGSITDDQRSVLRPQGVTCDIGAFEVEAQLLCPSIPDPLNPDLNHDGVVNILDVAQVGSCVGEDPTASGPCQGTDINDDGTIDMTDVNFVRSHVGQSDF